MLEWRELIEIIVSYLRVCMFFFVFRFVISYSDYKCFLVGIEKGGLFGGVDF